MNKFQELYTKIVNRLMPNPERDPDMYNFLKEIKEKLVDEPTLEECFKEWEALGYDVEDFGYKIVITKECIKDEINDSYTVFVKWINIFKRAKQYNSNYLITLQEHQLFTKTMKALGWL